MSYSHKIVCFHVQKASMKCYFICPPYVYHYEIQFLVLCESSECKFQHCREVGMCKDQAGHHDVCSLFPVACPNSCGEVKIAHRSLQSHRSLCPLESIECSLGCKSVVSSKELAKHESARCELRKMNYRYCEKLRICRNRTEFATWFL